MTYSINGIFPANENSWEDREAAVRAWEFTVRHLSKHCETPQALSTEDWFSKKVH